MLSQIEDKIRKTQSILEGILPIYHQVDRKKKSLEFDIQQLERERQRLLEGQTEFRFDLEF